MPPESQQDAHALLEVVRAMVAELRGHKASGVRITLDSELDRDLGFDSLARVELLVRIESAFGVQLPDTVLASSETCRDLFAALVTARAMTAAPARAVKQLPAPQLQHEDEGERAAPPELPTLTDVLAWHAARHAEVIHITLCEEEPEQTITYGRLWEQARAVAGGLQREGLQAGQTVALMLPTGAEYFCAFFGILLAGGIAVPIYPPARLTQVEEHIRRHARILDNAAAAMLITAPEIRQLARLLRRHVPALRQIATVTELCALQAPLQPVRLTGETTAFLQYTSGSTGQPKGVVLTHANLLANLRALGAALKVNRSDVFVSWLPLYHDMGLIGAWLGTLYFGCPLILMSPLAFLARPLRWLQAIHRYRGTLAAAPNFAYELCVTRLKDAELEGLDLSSWRVAANGAETVMPDTLARFQQRFGRYGLRPGVMTPVYGLAESSVGLTFPPLDRGPLIDRVERELFVRTGRANPVGAQAVNALRFVSCGLPLPGHQVRVVDEAGRELPERIEGRLQFTGPSATRGYFRNPQATAELIYDGWLDSGDRAYIANGELFVTGRVKDIVIRAGRHIYPDEVEAAVGEVAGVRKGCVAVFASRDTSSGTERLIVLAETHARDPVARSALRARVTERVVTVLGEPPDDVVLVAPHAVLKTSSGKIRRAASRELYEAGGNELRPRAIWLQMLRLGVSAVRPNLRRARQWSIEGLYAGYFWGLALVWALITWPVVALIRQPPRAWAVSRLAARAFMRLAGIPFVIHGADKPPRGVPCVVVANHASYLDGVIMLATLPQHCSFLAKRELQSNFFARVYLRRISAEFIERVDVRASVEDAERLTVEAHGTRSYMVFPEGTFTRAPGLMPFHLGAFMIAAGAGLAVVPAAIRGARSLLRDGQWFPRRGPLVVDIGDPILPPAGGDRFATAVKLRDAAREHIRRHCGEPDLASNE